MESFIGVLCAAAVLFACWKLFKPNGNDKLTQANLDIWIRMYSLAPPRKAAGMATALIVQSIKVANNAGLRLSVGEFMRHKARSGMLSTEVVSNWLDYLHDNLTDDAPLADLYQMPARAACGLVALKLLDQSAYRAFVR